MVGSLTAGLLRTNALRCLRNKEFFSPVVTMEREMTLTVVLLLWRSESLVCPAWPLGRAVQVSLKVLVLVTLSGWWWWWWCSLLSSFLEQGHCFALGLLLGSREKHQV